MLSSPTPYQLVSCVLLLLVCSGESRPQVAQKGASDVGSQRMKLLEAVKMMILNSLGMDEEPRWAQKASEEELRSMYQLYREKLQEIKGNSSHKMREPGHYTTVIFPVTVELIKALHTRGQRGRHMQWYRAVFQRNHNIQTELTLTRAELKISREVLERPTSARPRREVKVKVNGMRPAKTVAWAHINSPVGANVSGIEETVLNISPEVKKWKISGGSQALVVDVGVLVGEKGAPEVNPTISLELRRRKPKAAQRVRVPRSNKEDNCNEQGLCCRKSVTLSFKDIGWTDWVVAPAEYTMYFCDGACPHNYKPASMHTQVKSRLHQITKGGTPRPCCVPAAYEPMVLMHYDSRGKLKLTAFDDLIVSKCHCA